MKKRVRPDGVVQSTPQVKMLSRIVQSVYGDIINVATETSISSVARRLDISKELKRLTEEGRQDMYAWVDVTVPEFYLRGMENTVKKAIDSGAIVRYDERFVRLNKRAIDAIIQNGYASMDGAIDIAISKGNSILAQGTKQALLEDIAKKQITGESEKKLVKQMAQTIKSQGLDKVTTASGRNYHPDTYAEMLSRTLLTETQKDATINQMAADGHDLVIVSDHFDESDLCRPWENEILSVNGMYPQYTRLETAISEGLFHINCRHTIDPYYEEFAQEAKVWDANEGKYVPLQEAEPQNYQRLVDMSAKDKLKAFEEYTTKIGLEDYHGINQALQNGDKKSLDYYARKQNDPAMYEKIHRLRKYV